MKTFIIKCFSLFAVSLLAGVTSNAEQWRGITPLKSTRADVERLLGKPEPEPEGMSFLATYKLRTEEVNVLYAIKSLCNEPERCDCLVPDDTVIEIYVESKVKMKFSSLDIDKTTFDRFPLVENTSVIFYRNAEAGLTYAVSEKEDKVLYIQYSPTVKDCETIKRKTTKT
ncbi:MAG TPA: hypothetical protein VKB86_09345 [Pyrinomonadaceae bacterium]|nr:hypothetical protein [Pyrinomonadaceae bacterium]